MAEQAFTVTLPRYLVREVERLAGAMDVRVEVYITYRLRRCLLFGQDG